MKKFLLALLVLVISQLACSFGNNEKVNALIKEADQLVEEAKYTEAISIYNQALELDPKSSYAYSGRGTANRFLGNYEEALIDLSKAIELNKNNYQAYRERGVVFSIKGDNNSALSDCQKSVSINENFALGHLCLGYIYHDMGNFDKAYQEYSETIQLDSALEWAYSERGRLLYSSNRYSEAVDDFTKALSIKSNWDYAYFYRGLSYYYMGKYTNTIDDLLQVISINTNEYYVNESYSYIGEAYYYLKDFRKSVEYFTLAISHAPASDLARLYYNRAHTYDQLGENENTIADLTKYLELDKSTSEQAMEACARLNYLTIWGSSNVFSFFFNAIAPPCSRNQGYSNNEDYNTPIDNMEEETLCGPGLSDDQCAAAQQNWEQQFQYNSP